MCRQITRNNQLARKKIKEATHTDFPVRREVGKLKRTFPRAALILAFPGAGLLALPGLLHTHILSINPITSEIT